MRKFMKLLSLVCTLLVIKPAAGQVQICPTLFNNGGKVALVSTDMYNTFVNGNYEAFIFNTAQSTFVAGIASFTRVTDAGAEVAGAPNAPGVVIDFTGTLPPGDPGFPLNALQWEGTSITATIPGQAEPFLIMNFTNNLSDECIYVPLPVTFVSVTASWITSGSSLKIQWTTNDESQMDHFTVEKSTLSGPFVKVAHIAAQNGTVNNYQWIDNSPINKAIYRITGVDIDCKKTYSKQLLVNCSSCPTTFTPPSLTPDCVGPVTGPYLTGPTTVCGTTPVYYKVLNFMGSATVNWSLSNPYIATLKKAGRLVLVTPSGWGGFATLTATVVRNGISYTYSKDITFGTPAISVSYTNNTSNCNGTTIHTATVNPFSGTTGSQYSWYSGGTYIGTGLTKSWTILAGNIVNYQVRWYGPCGESVYIGSSTGPILESRAAADRYTVFPNPARGGNINVSLKFIPPCPEPPGPAPITPRASMRPLAGRAAPAKTVDVKVYDMYGNFRKAATIPVSSDRFTINAPELPTGWYYLHLAEPGNAPAKIKVWIER